MKRILVVDDNKDILQVVQIILQLRGFDVKAIWRGEETIQAVNDFSPHVVLLITMERTLPLPNISPVCLIICQRIIIRFLK